MTIHRLEWQRRFGGYPQAEWFPRTSTITTNKFTNNNEQWLLSDGLISVVNDGFVMAGSGRPTNESGPPGSNAWLAPVGLQTSTLELTSVHPDTKLCRFHPVLTCGAAEFKGICSWTLCGVCFSSLEYHLSSLHKEVRHKYLPPFLPSIKRPLGKRWPRFII